MISLDGSELDTLKELKVGKLEIDSLYICENIPQHYWSYSILYYEGLLPSDEEGCKRWSSQLGGVLEFDEY